MLLEFSWLTYCSAEPINEAMYDDSPSYQLVMSIEVP